MDFMDGTRKEGKSRNKYVEEKKLVKKSWYLFQLVEL